jgi:class 3 adenylate cyclase
MTGSNRSALLQRTEILRSVSSAVVAELVAGCSVVRLGVGEILFEKGASGDSLYIVETGQLEIFIGDARLDVAGPGESLGEMSLFTDEPRAASVRALEPTQLIELPRRAFRDVIERQPLAMIGLLRDLAGKVKSSIRVRVEQHKTTALVREAFARSVSTAVMEQILSRPDPHELLDGEERRATVLFADIRSFTSVSESLPPKEVLRRLNRCMSALTDVVFANGGTLDKYLGDGFMALFGVPIGSDFDASRAVRCAWEIQERLTELNAGADHVLRVGVGLATGQVVAGCVGSARRMEYTVIGDVVNLASRLEGLTKAYGTKFLVCGSTANAAGEGFVLRRVDRVRAKGKSNLTEVYDLLGPSSPTAMRHRDAYARAYAAYEEESFTDAYAGFTSVAEEFGDEPARIMASRSLALAADRPTAWDGVFASNHK